MPRSDCHADSRRYPHERSGGKPRDTEFRAKDCPRAEKSDAWNNLRRDTTRVSMGRGHGNGHREHGENAASDGNKGKGSKARILSGEFTLEPDECAQKGCDQELMTKVGGERIQDLHETGITNS